MEKTTYKSIFRQKYYEKLYKINIDYRSFFDQNKKLEVFHGNLIKEEIISTCDIEIPMLKPGENFFLSDIGKNVVIELRMRSSDGSIIYYVKDELIDTENTEKTFKECNEILSEKENLQKSYDNLNKEFHDYRTKYKYKNRWFNF